MVKVKTENVMKQIKVEKITLNCGAGVEARKLERSEKLLKMLGDGKVIRTHSKRRIPTFGIRIGQEIGCKITIRKKKAEKLLKRLLESIGNKLSPDQINPGSFAFGIKEYIEIPEMSYQRDIGILGLDVCVTLTRSGQRVIRKKLKKGHIGESHKILKEETIKFMEENFDTKIE